ncbi:MAG: magnesium-translocating P-type ATPase, partial [Chthonomonadaceae bacterium]|nr:magnesium-translocating P-type ATPase [Chthonomonadaceae bacterium]
MSIAVKETIGASQVPSPFWALSGEASLQQLGSSSQGLTEEEASRRLEANAGRRLGGRQRTTALVLFLSQFKSPIILLLVFAAGLSLFLGERVEALIIFLIVFVSGLLGFWQEHGAADAVEKLLAVVQIKTNVRREGKSLEITLERIVPGDIVLLSAGDVIPGDCLVLESNVLTVDEAALTGETFPSEKSPGTLSKETVLSQRTNFLYLGTHVVSGSA